MSKQKVKVFGIMIVFCLIAASSAMAKATPEEAARLGKDLTPFGAVRAGNEDGSIPEWDGGLKNVPKGISYNSGSKYPDPYSDDKILFKITSKNMNQYADQLTEGQKMMLQKHPDTYRIDVYPTHRGHALPDWVYNNSIHNATNCSLSEDGIQVQGDMRGGVLFPLPQNAEEIMKNHLTAYQGTLQAGRWEAGLIFANGEYVPGGGGNLWIANPLYYYKGDTSTWQFNGSFFMSLFEYLVPANRNGEFAVTNDYITQPRQAWQYLPGQRRVRRAPDLGWDMPNSSSSGLVVFDQSYVFTGMTDRYDWKIIGKKEIFVPYNTYKALSAPFDAFFTPRHANPDYIRWEKHRVWVVEATLSQGNRHVYPRRTFYVDEDSWRAVLADMYDSQNQLWKTQVGFVLVAYDVPATIQPCSITYDAYKTEYYEEYFPNAWEGMYKYSTTDEPIKLDFFTPENIRQIGRR
jgi:hypothetical protein